ncbi:MAG: cytochrome c [Gemmatimonadales bacterium]
MSAGRWIASATLACVLVACSGGKARTVREEAAELPPEGIIVSVPLGDIAGLKEDVLRGEIHNPFARDPAAINEGETYFHEMNCVSCHGYGARGGMGPSLQDSAWRYGGTPVEIYKSIAEGRPKGMPAWGAMLPPEVIWKLVAYIQSLGGATAPGHILAEVHNWAGEAPKGRRGDESH